MSPLLPPVFFTTVCRSHADSVLNLGSNRLRSQERDLVRGLTVRPFPLPGSTTRVPVPFKSRTTPVVPLSSPVPDSYEFSFVALYSDTSLLTRFLVLSQTTNLPPSLGVARERWGGGLWYHPRNFFGGGPPHCSLTSLHWVWKRSGAGSTR